ncbi:uncharacterized protein TRUGW13939_01641 [Talaromyces rugulosus]|uniref:Uncharacterized protein n=1 Tax=Talaromyces rugulosus TaxID=121627 RepID=A0A7H8QKV3_TALRU|nr:uncharacterized protein TRUGW13939_01641 [Talaromyces rugulosus]QKX54554.1 hypothetical protein TRUGW13939_01641 [Talaromyces rugulosus]
MSGRQVSHGRGGAGNIHTDGKPPMPADLVTPTIKQDFYTTGRGGSGNMMFNDKDRPEIARGSQDVEEPPKRSEESVQFTGRGGVANAVIPSVEEQKAKNTASAVSSGQQRDRVPSKERPKEVPGGKTT